MGMGLRVMSVSSGVLAVLSDFPKCGVHRSFQKPGAPILPPNSGA